jgi:carbonic anhydrase
MKDLMDRLISANRGFADRFDSGTLPRVPRLPVAVLTCMDARVDPGGFLGLALGDANVIRNAGGRASDDALRSLLISAWLLGTREFLVIHHTDCGAAGLDRDALIRTVRKTTGGDVSGIDFLGYEIMEESVREDVARVRGLGDRLPDGVRVSGWVYDVTSGELVEVLSPEARRPASVEGIGDGAGESDLGGGL